MISPSIKGPSFLAPFKNGGLMDNGQIGKKKKKPIDRSTRIEYIDRTNKYIEALAKSPFSNNEHRILFVILRKTLLFNKDEDCIARSQFAESTGIWEWNVSKIISKLVRRKAIVRTKRGMKTIGGWVDCYRLEEDSTKWEGRKHREVPPREERGVKPDTYSGQERHITEHERGVQIEQKRRTSERKRGVGGYAHKTNTKEYNKLSQSKFTESLTSTDPPSCEEVGSDNVIQHADKDKDKICKRPRPAPEPFGPTLARPEPQSIPPEIRKFIGDKCLEICKKEPDNSHGEGLDITFRLIRDGIMQIISTYGVPWEQLLPLLQSWTGWGRVAESPDSFKGEFEYFLEVNLKDEDEMESDWFAENEEAEANDLNDDVPF